MIGQRAVTLTLTPLGRSGRPAAKDDQSSGRIIHVVLIHVAYHVMYHVVLQLLGCC